MNPSFSQKCSHVRFVTRFPLQLCAISCATTCACDRSPANGVGVTKNIYDPRWPIDNSWIPPPEPDTWTFLKEIGRGTDEPEEDVKLRARIAAKNGIIQRFDDEEEADAFEYLAGASEEKLQRAVDIGEEDEDDDDGFRTP